MKRTWRAERALGAAYYYDVVYDYDENEGPLLVLRAIVDKKWYISSSKTTRLEQDIGPYARLKDAKVAMETMVDLGETPSQLLGKK